MPSLPPSPLWFDRERDSEITMVEAATIARTNAPAENGAGATAVPLEAEVVVLCAPTRAELAQQARTLADGLGRFPDTSLADLSFTLAPSADVRGNCLTLVADSTAELHSRLVRAAARLADAKFPQIKDTQGIYYFEQPLAPDGKLALLFPGAGAQYPNMLADLVPRFPEMRDQFAWSDRLVARGAEANANLSQRMLGAPEAAAQDLWQADNAFASVMIADGMMHYLLQHFGLRADATAGHSVGENLALWAAGCADFEDLLGHVAKLRLALDRVEKDAALAQATLLAVMAGRAAVQDILRVAGPEVFVAMDNCPHQTMVAGPSAVIVRVEEELRGRGIVAERLPLHIAFHTPLFRPLMPEVARLYESMTFRAGIMPVYSCSTGRPFSDDPAAIRQLALDLWHSPIEFTRTIETMYADGVRLFVEVGPRGNLTAFVEDILRGRPFAAVASNVSRRPGPVQLCHMLALLLAHHVPLRLEPLFRGRAVRPVSWLKSAEAAPMPAAAPRRHADNTRGAVVARHLAVMDQFLDLQRQAMEQYLKARPRDRANGPATPPPPARSSWPMLGKVVSQDPGQKLVARRRLDVAEDLFVLDHTLGGRNASAVDPEHHGLPVMPMVFSLEMMAEAAQVLVPQRRVIGFRQVTLRRWLAFDHDPTTVKITAERLRPGAGGVVEVKVTVIDEGNAERPGKTTSAAVEGTVLLADAYPQPPAGVALTLTDEAPCSIASDQVYEHMFHGPRFQAVCSTDRQGKEGIEGHLTTLPHTDLFRSTPQPDLLTDPLLLDASTHLLGCWHLSQPDQSGRVVFPLAVEALDLFGPRPPVGARIRCRVRVNETTARQINHRIDLLGPDGHLWCRMDGARYWRFYLAPEYVAYLRAKDRHHLGLPWPNALGETPHPACCVRLQIHDAIRQSGMLAGLARVSLSPTEWDVFRRLTGPERRPIEWLFGRIAAKDAVRLLWQQRHGERLFPADIEILPDALGRPTVRDRSGRRELPGVSIAHTAGLATALAAEQAPAGIDIERVAPRDTGFEEIAFSAGERRLLDGFGPARDEGIARFWCAREAVAKALGRGQVDGPRTLEVRGVDLTTGTVTVAPGRRLAAECPDLEDVQLQARTTLEDTLIVATILLPRASTCRR